MNMKERLGLSETELATIFSEIGDDVQVSDIKFQGYLKNSEPQVIVESAYSGNGFRWTIEKLRELEEKTGMKVKLCGGMYCHISITLSKQRGKQG